MSYILGWVPNDQPHPIVVVVNPNSRKNRRIGDRAERLRAAGGDLVDVVETANLVDLSRVLAPRLRTGVRYLVADGGDGAFHWTLNETLRQLGADRLPIMVPTRAGTIDFVAHKAGIRGVSEGIVRRLSRHVAEDSAPPTVRLDSVRLTDDDGFDRIGFAMAIGGVGQRFFDKYYEHDDPSPTTIVNIVSRTVASFAAKAAGRRGEYADQLFRPTSAIVTVDGKRLPETEHGAIHVGAFEISLGGVFRVFPLARASGVLHIQAGAITPIEMIRALPSLVRGGPIPSKRMLDASGYTMRVQACGDELLNPIVDGEQFRDLERLDVSVGPKIRVAVVDGRA